MQTALVRPQSCARPPGPAAPAPPTTPAPQSAPPSQSPPATARIRCITIRCCNSTCAIHFAYTAESCCSVCSRSSRYRVDLRQRMHLRHARHLALRSSHPTQLRHHSPSPSLALVLLLKVRHAVPSAPSTSASVSAFACSQQIRTAPLIEPPSNPSRQRSIPLRRDHRRLPAAARLRVVLLHRRLPRRQFLLNLPTLIPTHPRQIIARIVQLIRVQLQLRLRHVQVIRQRIRRRLAAFFAAANFAVRSSTRAWSSFTRSCSSVIFCCNASACSGQRPRLQRRLPQRHRKRLVHLMVRQPLRLPRQLLLLRRHRQRSQRRHRLPRPLIHQPRSVPCSLRPAPAETADSPSTPCVRKLATTQTTNAAAGTPTRTARPFFISPP